MKKMFRRVNKKFVAIFVPLTAASLIIGGVTPLWTLATLMGVGCIVQRLAQD